MTQWHSKDLGDGIDANAPRGEIREAFLPLFAAKGCPVGMAVFSHYDLEKNIVTVYFSPGASVLAKTFGASPCEKPKKVEGFGLLVGDARAAEFFYPSAK